MDDTAALRRTLRRCTAVLVAVLGVIAAYSAPYGPDTSIGYPLTYAASAYLGVSLLVGLFRRAGEAGPDESHGSTGENGGGGDGTEAAELSGDDEEAAGGDDEETADGGGETDQPPVSTFGGGHW